MPITSRLRAPRILAAAALVGLSVALTACVSDKQGQAFGPPPTATVPPIATVPPAATVVPIPLNKPAAVVAGTPIAGGEYAAMAAEQATAAAFQSAQNPNSPPPPVAQIRAVALNTLINRNVIRIYAHSQGMTVTPQEVQTQFDRYVIRFGGVITFTNTLRNFGFTTASFKAQLPDIILQQKVQQKIAPLPAVIPEVQARHILVKTRALANAIYTQLKQDPSKFAALARKYSTDTGSKNSGGELGTFPHGAMTPPFDRAAFLQPVGAIGTPVQSQFGYHIIQVEAHKQVPFSQLDQNTQQQYTQVVQTAFTTWINHQRALDHVKVLAKG